jgi:hypothetical protein
MPIRDGDAEQSELDSFCASGFVWPLMQLKARYPFFDMCECWKASVAGETISILPGGDWSRSGNAQDH